jgi:hypothetical protein
LQNNRVFSYLGSRTNRRSSAYQNSRRIKSPGLWVARSLGGLRNGGRRARGSQWYAHRRWRQAAAAGFWRRAELGRTTGSGGQRCGGASGRPATRSERWLAQKAMLWTLGRFGRSAPDVQGAECSWRLIRTVHNEKEREKGIRWQRPQNCRLHGKTERKHQDERDGVLTFGQRSTMATEALAGVGEGSADSGKTTKSTLDSRDRPQHNVELNGGNSMVVSVCTRSERFRRNLVDAKVR